MPERFTAKEHELMELCALSQGIPPDNKFRFWECSSHPSMGWAMLAVDPKDIGGVGHDCAYEPREYEFKGVWDRDKEILLPTQIRVLKDLELLSVSFVTIPGVENMTKEEKEQYCLDHGLGWVAEDKKNDG